MHWIVRLEGEVADLTMLAEASLPSEWQVIHHGAGFALRSSLLSPESSAESVMHSAREIVQLLSGASMAILGTPRPLVASSLSLIQDDGRENQYVFLEPAVVTARGLPVSIVLTRADGSTETYRPTDPLKTWLPLALKSPEAARALRIRSRTGLDWDDLLRILEVVQSSGIPFSSIPNAPPRSSIDRLSQTANSVHALGDESRHPGRNYDPPSDPMSLSEAKAIVDRLLNAWLTHLGQ